MPPELLEQYEHPPEGYRQQARQAQQAQQARQAQQLGGGTAGSSSAGATSDAPEWQGLEAGRASSAESLDVKGSLRRKYGRLPSSSSTGSRAAGGGSAGTRSNSFASAAAAAVAAAGFAGSRTSSFRGGGSAGGQLGGTREQPPSSKLLGTILESERGSSSSGGRTSGSSGGGSSGGGSSGGGSSSRGSGSGAGDGSAAGSAPPVRQPGAPSRLSRQLSGQLAGPAVEEAGGSEDIAEAINEFAAVRTEGAARPPQSPSLLSRLRSLLPGGSPPGASAPTGSGGASSPRQLQQVLSGAGRSRSVLRMLSSRQLSRVSPHSGGEELPAGQPLPGPPTLQHQMAAAAQRLSQRPASLVPGGEAQQQQAQLLAAAQLHLARLQAAPDEATMHAERRQVGLARHWDAAY